MSFGYWRKVLFLLAAVTLPPTCTFSLRIPTFPSTTAYSSATTSALMATSTSDNTEESNSNNNAPFSNEFEEKLRYNLDRFAKILLDELDEQKSSVDENNQNVSSLLTWLQDSYGTEKTRQLQADQFESLSSEEQRSQLQAFLQWFRHEFPYYRDECDHCGAKGGTFQGDVAPTPEERSHSGWIDTTEVYQCPTCQQITRFPRYLAALEIARRHRGRCSEYSLLLYRILRALGLSSRWIVDWANHVWAEIQLSDNRQNGNSNSSSNNSQWVHLDPCEAALDTPLLYEEWGKKQTYIMAFEAPPIAAIMGQHHVNNNNNNNNNNTNSETSKNETVDQLNSNNTQQSWSVVDVTKDYTSEDWETILARRAADGVTPNDVFDSLKRANQDLQELSLLDIVEGYKNRRTNM